MQENSSRIPADSFLTKRGLETFADDQTSKNNRLPANTSLNNDFLKQQLDYHSQVRIEQGREKPIDRFFKILFFKDKSILLENEEIFEDRLKTPLRFFDSLTIDEINTLIIEIEVS